MENHNKSFLFYTAVHQMVRTKPLHFFPHSAWPEVPLLPLSAWKSNIEAHRPHYLVKIIFLYTIKLLLPLSILSAVLSFTKLWKPIVNTASATGAGIQAQSRIERNVSSNKEAWMNFEITLMHFQHLFFLIDLSNLLRDFLFLYFIFCLIF